MHMKTAAIGVLLAMAVGLVGCASGKSPEEVLLEIEANETSHKGATACQKAKKAAREFNDEKVSRLLTRIGLSSLLGPLSLPINWGRNKTHQDKRDVVIAQMHKNCAVADSK